PAAVRLAHDAARAAHGPLYVAADSLGAGVPRRDEPVRDKPAPARSRPARLDARSPARGAGGVGGACRQPPGRRARACGHGHRTSHLEPDTDGTAPARAGAVAGMPCPACGRDNPAGQKFCGECGARLAAVCAGCGAANPPGQKFCGECGRALAAAAPAAPSPRGEAAPGFAIGSDLRMDYTAVGQTTHLAARMEQLAPAGTIPPTARPAPLAAGFVQLVPLGPIPVKGVTEPVEVFELTGASAVRTRLQAARARGLTRFVGRDVEVDQLRQAAEQARRGRGQVVAVVGDPGVGKSRLFHEFLQSHHLHGWLVLEASSVSYGQATPFLPLADLLRRYL